MSEHKETPRIRIYKSIDTYDGDSKSTQHLSMKLKVKTTYSETLVTLLDLYNTESADWLKLLEGDHTIKHQHSGGLIHIESSADSIMFKVIHYSNVGFGLKQYLKLNKCLCERFILDVAEEIKRGNFFNLLS